MVGHGVSQEHYKLVQFVRSVTMRPHENNLSHRNAIYRLCTNYFQCSKFEEKSWLISVER